MARGGPVLRTPHRLVLLVVLVCGLLAPTVALAHPLGNFTTNTALRLVVGQDEIRARYVLDLAEIPTVQVRQSMDADDDGEVDDDERAAFAAERCATIGDAVAVTLAGDDLDLDLSPVDLTFPAGQAGLVTTRLVCDGSLPGVTTDAMLAVADLAEPDRIGWREITIVGDEVRVDADVPADSTTNLLRVYPDAATSTPQRVTEATATLTPGGPAAPGDAIDPGVDGGVDDEGGEEGFFEGLTSAYTDLVAEREATPGFLVVAVLLAMVLGASHAVAPGHGKTVMAAYVVGERGTPRQALAIGATVAMTHTVGTLLLGAVLQASETLAPERLYPVFGVVSGALIVAIGIGMLRSASQARARHRAHGHDDHDHTHVDHDHHAHDPDEYVTTDTGETVLHHHGHTHVIPDPDMGWRRLVVLGVAGGLAPSPSALLVLLGAIALGRTALGIGLVAAYGVGLAAVLVGVGLLLVRFRSVAERLLRRRQDGRLARITRVLPFVTGVAVVVGGLVVAGRGLLLG